MTRRLWLAALPGVLFAANRRNQAPTSQQPPPPSGPPAQSVPDESTLPEDDETVAPEKFVLNPLESDRNVKVGNFYFKKRDFRGALGRYERASKFNPSSALAFFKIGEAEEELHDAEKARLAFKKVVDLAPDSKLGREAKKKLAAKASS